jgi:hypothetical protein
MMTAVVNAESDIRKEMSQTPSDGYSQVILIEYTDIRRFFKNKRILKLQRGDKGRKG